MGDHVSCLWKCRGDGNAGRDAGQHLLHLYVDLPCICRLLSGYADLAVFYHSDQNEVDGLCLCCFNAVGSGTEYLAAQDRDGNVAFEFCDLLFVNKGSAPLFTKGGASQAGVSPGGKAAAEYGDHKA